MNIEFIIENASKIILIVAAICTLISVITEFTKGIGFLDKIPTKFQVLILSLVICVIGFFAYLSYASIAFVWYYLVAVIFAAFIVAIVCCKAGTIYSRSGPDFTERRTNQCRKKILLSKSRRMP